MRAGVCTFLIAMVSSSMAQNLVPNGSFEEYYKCPGSYSVMRNGKIAPGWVSPSTGTPDLFHACSIGEAGVPTNWAGKSKAFSGAGYAGIYAYIFGRSTEYREYLQAEFTTSLEAGVKYQVEFHYKLSSNSRYSIDRIGFLISDSSYQTTEDRVFPATATYQRINRVIYNQNSGYWTRFGFSYIAKGGERYITIGNFSDDVDTRYYFISNSQATEPLLSRAAYFFVDDVKVIQISNTPHSPVLSGYPEIKTDENYVLKNIQFRFNDYTLMETSFSELNRVAEILYYHKTWKVIVSGHTDDVGSDAFNLELSLQRAGSVVDYLITKGIDPSRIKAQGLGKQAPLQKGDDDATRAINRRVEIRFLNK